MSCGQQEAPGGLEKDNKVKAIIREHSGVWCSDPGSQAPEMILLQSEASDARASDTHASLYPQHVGRDLMPRSGSINMYGMNE